MTVGTKRCTQTSSICGGPHECAVMPWGGESYFMLGVGGCNYDASTGSLFLMYRPGPVALVRREAAPSPLSLHTPQRLISWSCQQLTPGCEWSASLPFSLIDTCLEACPPTLHCGLYSQPYSCVKWLCRADAAGGGPGCRGGLQHHNRGSIDDKTKRNLDFQKHWKVSELGAKLYIRAAMGHFID